MCVWWVTSFLRRASQRYQRRDSQILNCQPCWRLIILAIQLSELISQFDASVDRVLFQYSWGKSPICQMHTRILTWRCEVCWHPVVLWIMRRIHRTFHSTVMHTGASVSFTSVAEKLLIIKNYCTYNDCIIINRLFGHRDTWLCDVSACFIDIRIDLQI